MITSISAFKKSWANETQSTLTIFKAISNDKFPVKPHENIRSLQRLSWHITLTIGEMMGKAGLQNIDCPDEHTPPPNTVEELCKTYETAAKSLAEQVEKQWSDADLATEVNMYGEMWSKGTILEVLMKHEIHHRGQLTVIMRLLGLTVPGTYGPSKEEWAAWNMPAMD